MYRALEAEQRAAVEASTATEGSCWVPVVYVLTWNSPPTALPLAS